MTLYDEQEIMDQYVKSAVAREVAKEVEKAREREKWKSGIRTTVRDYQDFGQSIHAAIKRVPSKYNLSKEAAEMEVRQYWK